MMMMMIAPNLSIKEKVFLIHEKNLKQIIG